MLVKFLTINILHGGIFWDNLVEFIHSQKPDVLALQEVFNSKDLTLEKRYRTIDEFTKEFDFLPHNAFEATMTDRSSNSPWGNAVFSKFPITSKRNITFNGNPFEYDFIIDDPDPSSVVEGMVEAKLDIAGKEVFVYSWHGVWDTHGADTPKRYEMERVIVENLKYKKNIILAGDTNLVPNTKFVKDIELQLNLKSVFKDTLPSTFNMLHKTKPGYATAAVDMIFVSDNFQVLSCEMPKADISDHYPLIVNLEI